MRLRREVWQAAVKRRLHRNLASFCDAKWSCGRRTRSRTLSPSRLSSARRRVYRRRSRRVRPTRSSASGLRHGSFARHRAGSPLSRCCQGAAIRSGGRNARAWQRALRAMTSRPIPHSPATPGSGRRCKTPAAERGAAASMMWTRSSADAVSRANTRLRQSSSSSHQTGAPRQRRPTHTARAVCGAALRRARGSEA